MHNKYKLLGNSAVFADSKVLHLVLQFAYVFSIYLYIVSVAISVTIHLRNFYEFFIIFNIKIIFNIEYKYRREWSMSSNNNNTSNKIKDSLKGIINIGAGAF